MNETGPLRIILDLKGRRPFLSLTSFSVIRRRSNNKWHLRPGLYFINILRVRFSYESAFLNRCLCFSLVTFWQKKHFRTKTARIKCWWNWPQGSIKNVGSRSKFRLRPPKLAQLCILLDLYWKGILKLNV